MPADKKRPRSICRSVALATVLLASLSGAAYLWAIDVYKSTLQERVVLENNSQAFEWWTQPPVQPLMKAYLFNYTNAQAYWNKEEPTPRVNQIGPYTYRMKLERVNVQMHDDGTVSFQEKRSYQFLRNMSVGDPEVDQVVVPNMVLISAVSEARDYFFLAQMWLDAAMQGLGTRPFVQLPVSRLLWGYNDRLFEIAKWRRPMPFPKFGLLTPKAGVDPMRLRMGTGIGDVRRLGVLTSVGGRSSLDAWGDATCDSIAGSDGSVFPPSDVSTGSTLHIFHYFLCRRLPLVFRNHSQVAGGIPTLRFQLPRDVFDSPRSKPENACFCHRDADFCPPSGVFNASPCAFGAPVFLSFPHFYLGDPSLREAVQGLSPDEELHDSYLDIYPKVGVPLSGWFRMQLNIMVRTSPHIQIIHTFKDKTILPVAWFEMGLEELPSYLQTMFVHMTYSARALQLTLMYGLPSLAVVCLYLLYRHLSPPSD